MSSVPWREALVQQLKERNHRESESYHSFIQINSRFFDTIQQLRKDNIRLSFENDRLRSEPGGSSAGGSSGTGGAGEVQALEKKLLAQQEELTDLHKRKGENSQMIVDLNMRLSDLSQQLLEKEQRGNEQAQTINSLRAEIRMLTANETELKALNNTLRDEHMALHLHSTALEEKLRKAQEDNQKLLEKLTQYEQRVLDKLNEENEQNQKKRSEKMRRDLEDAASDPAGAGSPMGSMADVKGAPFYSCNLPSNVHLKFDAHDGEVNAVRWCPMDRLVATGGADRKVKLWDVGKGVLDLRATLIGSNAGVNSIDFDMSGTMLMATSNDQASRIWTLADQRIRHTLTGHSAKVMAGKFLSDSKAVTGSYDRTLKIWDLRSHGCTETKFAGSSCNDLVTTDGSGTTFISGHFDKKVRFWDTRTDASFSERELQGKVTSLDLSKDCKYLLCCVRNDTVQMLDLRNSKEVLRSFAHEDFKVGCDWTRVAFSFDGSSVAAGSADGSVFIWHTNNASLAAVLKEHSSAVVAVSWHPFSSVLASVDRSKKCTIWVD